MFAVRYIGHHENKKQKAKQSKNKREQYTKKCNLQRAESSERQ